MDVFFGYLSQGYNELLASIFKPHVMQLRRATRTRSLAGADQGRPVSCA
jgi:hypothetical protein